MLQGRFEELPSAARRSEVERPTAATVGRLSFMRGARRKLTEVGPGL